MVPMELVPLVILAPIGLVSFGLFAPDRYRASLIALAIAFLPLATVLWANLASLPALFAEGTRTTLNGADLSHKLGWILAWGVLPASLAWWVIWRAPAPCACPRLPLRPIARASRGAAATLIVVAFVGLGLGLLPGPFQATATHGLDLWSNVTPWLLVGLSLSAAIAEELLFRGVVYVSLVPLIGFVGGGIVQGVLFGLVHTAYGDPLYVLAAMGFGFLQAYVSVRWGLLVAVMVHAQVNLVILGWASRASFELNGLIVVGLVAFNLLLVAPAGLACLTSRRAQCPVTPEAGMGSLPARA